ncbi:hypothetical protein F2Q70_00033788 [Brassica cretica]|uniref:Uncharacterized protein n=1 Tax=Brassica cretica TaxID=69181 RepID=A0A8S9GAE2_BRACR|nr:hypothetical protein F2Q68_00028668 [Brassica cretica]KAF2586826.1 hypothetical protein F2Q70_00033788 [Brassica cretica]
MLKKRRIARAGRQIPELDLFYKKQSLSTEANKKRQPKEEEARACFTRWKEAKDKEEKVFTEFIAKKVKPGKLDDVTMITGIASPPAAKRAGENVPQLKFIKLIPDVIFVPMITILAIVSAKLSRRMYLK